MTDQAIGSLDDPPANDEPARPLTQPEPGAGAQRPARVPLGWLPPERGEFLLANQAGAGLSDTQRARVGEARDAVAARPGGIDQADLVSALPAELADHVARLEMTPGGATIRTEGWDIAMVDLNRVVAFQPHVFTDTAIERVAGLDPDDLGSIAELTLPINYTAPVSFHYDELKQAYIITSPDPNLKVIANIGGPLPDGVPGFGFKIGVAPPFMQVARFQGRYLLRDGYHRSFGLLTRGITCVPALVRDFDTTENLARPECCPRASGWATGRPCCAITTMTMSRSRSSCRRSTG